MATKRRSTTEIASFLGITERHVRRLVVDGVLADDGGGFDLLDTAKRYIAYVSKDHEGRKARAESARVEAMARRLKIEQHLGRLISTKELRGLGDELWGGVLQVWNLCASHLYHGLSGHIDERERLRVVGEIDQTAKAELHLLRERFAERLKGAKVELEDAGRIEREMARLAGGDDDDDADGSR